MGPAKRKDAKETRRFAKSSWREAVQLRGRVERPNAGNSLSQLSALDSQLSWLGESLRSFASSRFCLEKSSRSVRQRAGNVSLPPEDLANEASSITDNKASHESNLASARVLPAHREGASFPQHPH